VAFRPLNAELVAVMSPDERVQYDRALQRHVALQSPLDLALLTTPETQEFRHVRLLNTLIVALTEHRLYEQGPCPHVGITDPEVFEAEGVEALDSLVHPDVPCHVPAWEPVKYKLFVTMPPRHGKSFLITEHSPAWFLFRRPDERVIIATYEADFAADWGRKVRNIVEAHGELFDVQLDRRSQAADHFEIDGRRGGLITAGAGGGITGKGGNFLICDDPIKNSEEAASEVMREKLWKWWHTTFKTRRQGGSGAVMLLIHTRWHEDDLGGRLMKAEGDEWFHIDLPALQPEDPDELQDVGIHSRAGNPLERSPGAALCPQLFTRAYLLKERAPDPAAFDALYQQRPTTEGAGVFRRQDFRYWKPLGTQTFELLTPDGPKWVEKDECYFFQTIDLAATSKTYSDWSVISTWAVTPDRELLLVARHRQRTESADHVEMFLENLEYVRDRLKYRVKVAGVENKTYGVTLIQQLRRKRAIPVRSLDVDGDKVMRALPAGAACKDGIVYWPAEAEWLSEWESEHLKFPLDTHDDQVDTTAYAVWMLFQGALQFRLPKKDPEDRSMEGRVQRHMERLRTKRRNGAKVHPELGRVR